MKVLFLTRLYKPHVGGIEKHVYEVSRLLKKKGHKVTIVTTKYDDKLKEIEVVDGIKVYRFNQPNIKLIGLIDTWYWFLKNISLIKQSDVIHIHDIFAWYFPFKLLLNKKVYITYHGRWGQYPIPKRDIYQKRLGAKLANGVLCIGNYIPKHYGFDCDKVSYGAVKPIKSVKKDEKLVVYVGRLDEDTALSTYLPIFKKLKSYKIFLFEILCQLVHHHQEHLVEKPQEYSFSVLFVQQYYPYNLCREQTFFLFHLFPYIYLSYFDLLSSNQTFLAYTT